MVAALALTLVAHAQLPSIQVIYPNGGDVLMKNGQYLLKWSGPVNARYNLSLINSNGVDIGYIAQDLFAPGNQYTWNVGSLTQETEAGTAYVALPAGSYQLEVTTIQNEYPYSDRSDYSFTINEYTYTPPYVGPGASNSSGGSVYQPLQSSTTPQTTSVASTSTNTGSSNEIGALQAYIATLQQSVDRLRTNGTGINNTSNVSTGSAPLSYVWSKNLEFGMTGDQDVFALQRALTAEGVFKGPITGNFYSLTREGVKAFQRKYKFMSVPDSGLVGPYTRSVLNGIYKAK